MANQERLDMDLMAEAELIRLQRQYRIMEGDRQAFLSDIKNKLIKQRKEITILENERNELLNNYRIATCENQRKKDVKNAAIIEKLIANFDEIHQNVQKSKQELHELQQQIRKTDKELRDLHLKQMPDNEYENRLKSGKKTIARLENRHDTTTKKFCKILTNNQQLRKEIDHLLIERQHYNDMWQKLIDKYDQNKKLMLDLIEQAIQAYDQRDEWCSKLQALKIRAHNDTIIHTQDMREMQRQLDQYGNLKDFLIIKGQKRINRDLEQKELQRKEHEQNEYVKQQQLLKDTLKQIQEICNEVDNDEDDGDGAKKIVGKYLKQDEENFALFTYANELNHELENLKVAIKQLEEKIGEQNELNVNDENVSKLETLNLLELELNEITQLAENFTEKQHQQEKEFRSVLQEIKEIFDLLKCDSTPILQLLNDVDQQIDEKNAMIYLSLIRTKIATLYSDDEYFKSEIGIKGKKSRK